MRIEDGLKLKGKPAEIPDTSRDDLPQFFANRGYKVGVEVGVCAGEYTQKLCQAGLEVFGVDPWTSYNGYKDHYVKHRDYMRGLESLYQEARDRTKEYNCTLVRKKSLEAVDDFEDESIDFVYIDGNHSFRYIAEDLFEWSKKVKKGGVISGHDYYISKHSYRYHDICHVKPVVDAFIYTFQIPNFWVLGKRYAPNRDKWRSFFWIKE